MSADGELEVAVRAEGVDQAAQEFAGDMEGDMADLDAPDLNGDGRRRQRGRDGGKIGAKLGGILGAVKAIPKIAAVVAVLAAVTKALEPTITAIGQIMEAFIAPVQVMLLRLFQPVLRFLIELLPLWFDFIERVEPLIERIQEFIGELLNDPWGMLSRLPDLIWEAISAGASWLTESITSIAKSIGSEVWEAIKSGVSWLTDDLPSIATTFAQEIWEFLKQLPGMIADRLGEALPELPDAPGLPEGPGLPDAPGSGDDPRQTVVNITGGLGEFVDGIQRDGRVDLP